jgi:hypothetical protein
VKASQIKKYIININGASWQLGGCVVLVGRHLDKEINYTTLFLSIVLFVFAFGSTFSSTASAAIDSGGHYTYAPATASTNPNLVCGDHICHPGEVPKDLQNRK